jgi:hypothetical protein
MKDGPFKSKTLGRLWNSWTLKRCDSEMSRLLSIDREFIKLESDFEHTTNELMEENKKLKEELELQKVANLQLNKTLLYAFEHRD